MEYQQNPGNHGDRMGSLFLAVRTKVGTPLGQDDLFHGSLLTHLAGLLIKNNQMLNTLPTLSR
jgi:hypothetical protein